MWYIANMELTLQELRSLGGKAVKKKYGIGYFKELNKKSQEAKRKKKNEAILVLDNG